MVTVVEKSPSQFCVYTYYTQRTDAGLIYSSSDKIICFSSFSTLESQIELGSIVTTPSNRLPGCNNCQHISVKGKVTKVTQPFIMDITDRDTGRGVTVTFYRQDGTRFAQYDCVVAVVDGENTLYAAKNKYVTSEGGGWIYHHSCSLRRVMYSASGVPTRWYMDDNIHKTYCGRDEGEGYIEWWGSFRSNHAVKNFQPSALTGTVEMLRESYSNEYGSLTRLISALKQKLYWEYDHGDLSRDASQSIRICDINGIAYLKDFVEVASLAKSLLAVTGLNAVSQVPKVVSSLYLAVHYGVRLTLRDTEELAEGIDNIDFEHSYQSLGAQKTIQLELPGRSDTLVNCTQRLSGKIRNFTEEQLYFLDKLKKARRALFELDLAPTVSNIWDLIPFSFLVDWFIPIGDQAEVLESRSYLQTLLVHQLFYSDTYEWSQRIDEVSLNGNYYVGRLQYRYYERFCTDEFVNPSLSHASTPKANPVHWIEGAALFLSLFS